MQIVRGYKDCPNLARGSVVALGNFDGVHLGHRAVIEEAKRLGAPSAVLTFEPHPLMILRPHAMAQRLTPLRQKMNLLESLGVDITFLLPFTRAFSEMSAQDFVEQILVHHLKVRHVVTGQDFVFGHKRQGNAELLRLMAAKHGFGYTEVKPQGDGAVYSSTRIRQLLQQGELQEALAILGHDFVIEGRVIKGQSRGKGLGYPTANIALKNMLRPALGIYRVEAKLDKTWLPAIASLGKNPTFGEVPERLEVHIFDFDKDIYGKRIAVRLLEYLRPEQKFDTIDALKLQMEKDCIQAKRGFQ